MLVFWCAIVDLNPKIDLLENESGNPDVDTLDQASAEVFNFSPEHTNMASCRWSILIMFYSVNE